MTSQEQQKKQKYRCLKLTMEKEKYDIIMKAIKNIQKQEPTINEARALELIAADYLAGICQQ